MNKLVLTFLCLAFTFSNIFAQTEVDVIDNEFRKYIIQVPDNLLGKWIEYNSNENDEPYLEYSLKNHFEGKIEFEEEDKDYNHSFYVSKIGENHFFNWSTQNKDSKLLSRWFKFIT